jgi:hypothetical protein
MKFLNGDEFVFFFVKKNDHAKLLSHLGFDPEQMNKQIEEFVANLPPPKVTVEPPWEGKKTIFLTPSIVEIITLF